MESKRRAGIKAVEYVKDGMIVGLGTGSTAYYAIEEIGKRVKQGLNISAVATSVGTESLAEQFHIPLLDSNEIDHIDLTIDGVDEIDPQLNAIKGGGGALLREKITASFSDEVIWIMDASKQVPSLGSFPLPVEVLPFGCSHVLRKLSDLRPSLRMDGDFPFVTDNGNYIIDLHLGTPFPITEISRRLSQIPGILETGLFLNMCSRIIVGTAESVKTIENNTQ